MTPEERFAKIEDVLARMINQHAQDFQEMKALWRQVGEQQLATTQQIQTLVEVQRSSTHEIADYQRETERRLRESGERLDARIEKFVSGIMMMVSEGKPHSSGQ